MHKLHFPNRAATVKKSLTVEKCIYLTLDSIRNELVGNSEQFKLNQYVRNPYILLAAQSNPDDKELIIKLVVNLIRS